MPIPRCTPHMDAHADVCHACPDCASLRDAAPPPYRRGRAPWPRCPAHLDAPRYTVYRCADCATAAGRDRPASSGAAQRRKGAWRIPGARCVVDGALGVLDHLDAPGVWVVRLDSGTEVSVRTQNTTPLPNP